MKVTTHAVSDVGNVRKINEDRTAFSKSNFGFVAVICDGMGGYEGGEVAAEIASKYILQHFLELPPEFKLTDEIVNAFIKANDEIIRQGMIDSKLSMMGTTAGLLVFKKNYFTTAHLGDSRVYLVRKGEIRQLTKDHSLVEQIREANGGKDNGFDLEHQKNIITRSLGINSLSTPEIADVIKLELNDVFILCTDGVTNFVLDDEILNFVTEFPPNTASEQIVYLAKLRESTDNCSAIVVKVDEL